MTAEIPGNNPLRTPPPPATFHGVLSECSFEEGNPTCANAGYTVDISDCNGAIGRATAWGLPSTLVSAAVGALLVAALGSSVV